MFHESIHESIFQIKFSQAISAVSIKSKSSMGISEVIAHFRLEVKEKFCGDGGPLGCDDIVLYAITNFWRNLAPPSSG
jgi:hypothetical protein